MVLDPKHFDDIDDFCDFDDKLEPSSDGDSDCGPSPLSWRRIIIERAAGNVKKAQEAKTDIGSSHKIGTLIFDEQANKFGRVLESRPGFLNLNLLAGGKLIRRDVNQLDFVRDNRQKLTLPEMAEKLVMTEVEIIGLLNQLEAEEDNSVVKPSVVKAAPAGKLPKKKAAAGNTKKEAKKKPELKITLPSKSKAPTKIATKKVAAPKAKLKLNKEVSFTKLLPKGATTDPVMDPNGYIQQNFLLMSNRELANATGLSEHTIRRKLGEWNLKRKDFVNKA